MGLARLERFRPKSQKRLGWPQGTMPLFLLYLYVRDRYRHCSHQWHSRPARSCHCFQRQCADHRGTMPQHRRYLSALGSCKRCCHLSHSRLARCYRRLQRQCAFRPVTKLPCILSRNALCTYSEVVNWMVAKQLSPK